MPALRKGFLRDLCDCSFATFAVKEFEFDLRHQNTLTAKVAKESRKGREESPARFNSPAEVTFVTWLPAWPV